jgi:hypothetical protein
LSHSPILGSVFDSNPILGYWIFEGVVDSVLCSGAAF